jgi:hypothetical protein
MWIINNFTREEGMFSSGRSFFLITMALLVVSTLLLGCSQKVIENTKEQSCQSKQDWFADSPSGEGNIVNWGSGSEGLIMKAAAEGPLSFCIGNFERQGFRVAYQYSFIITGEATNPDNDSLVELEMIVIPMEMPGDSTIAAYVTQISNPEIGWVVIPDLISSVAKPNFDMLDIGDRQLWLSELMPIYSLNLYPTYPMAAKWSWKGWIKCSVERFTNGCVAAGGMCMFSTVAYLHCVGIGCGASAVGSMLSCAVGQLLK